MNTQTLNLSGGYTAVIATDEGPENPWEAWDCQPPIMRFDPRQRGLETYKTYLSLRSIYDALPLSAFEGGAAAVLKALDLDAETVDGALPWGVEAGSLDAEGWREIITECLPEDPTGWRDAGEYFDACESLCRLAGIPCLNDQSNGYCQGDSVRLFLAATPAWVSAVGIAPENIESALKADFKLWGAWAWGDVYGIVSIHRPDGEEIEDGSVWGFYGADHKESGLLGEAEQVVKADRQDLARQAEADRLFQEREDAESFRAACSDIITA